MPAMQPIDRDVFSGLKSGDEGALEKVFRARFAPLSEQASAALGDDAGSAPRVVEGAFVRIWEERGQIESPEALEQFLFDAVNSAAARERSRKAAAHRMAHGHNGHATTHSAGATVTVDDAWTHVTQTLHAPVDGGHHSPRVQDELHSQLRHGAATHVAALGKKRGWQVPTLAAIVVAGAIFGAIRWLDHASVDAAVTSALGSADGHNVSTLASQSGATTLGDGSKVTLAADTKVRIPPAFDAPTRAIRVDGAAQIEAVAKPAGGKPLTIRAGDASIEANGATVDVTNYPGDKAAFIRVRAGSAAVKSLTTGTTQTLSAGSVLAIAPDGQTSTPNATAVSEAFGWVDKQFVVSNQTLGSVLPLLVRWYGLELKVPDKSLLSRPVTMSASLESSREVIAALEKAANVQFGYQDKTMVLTAAKP